jgi:mono/diheme cytochrome c family protein
LLLRSSDAEFPMSKKPFVIFGLVLAFLAVVVPAWAFMRDGDPNRAQTEVPANLKSGQSLFVDNCGNCHKLYAAGTYGDFGPDLDQQLAPAGTPEGPDAASQIEGTKAQVLSAIELGADDPTVSGRMPAGIVSGPVADEIAEFVAQTAGRG